MVTMADKINVEITRETWRRLNARKEPGDTFDDVVRRLLEEPAPEPEAEPEGEGTPLTCHKCGYSWEYGGSKSTATCPDCRATVKVDG